MRHLGYGRLRVYGWGRRSSCLALPVSVSVSVSVQVPEQAWTGGDPANAACGQRLWWVDAQNAASPMSLRAPGAREPDIPPALAGTCTYPRDTANSTEGAVQEAESQVEPCAGIHA